VPTIFPTSHVKLPATPEKDRFERAMRRRELGLAKVAVEDVTGLIFFIATPAYPAIMACTLSSYSNHSSITRVVM